MIETDVAVIGGGPGGSCAAAWLARRGLRTTLVDRDRFPRDKVCGEFLSWDASPFLEDLGLSRELDELDAPVIDDCRIHAGSASTAFSLPRASRGISRLRLDALLVARARALGGEILEGWSADETSRHEGSRTIHIRSTAGEMRELRARAVVGAWGRWGRLDLALGRDFVRDRGHRYIGFKRHYAGGVTAAATIELHSFPGGYLGAQQIEGHLSNLCGLVHQGKIAGMRGGWPAFVREISCSSPSLARLLDGAAPAQEEFLSSEPVIFRPKSAAHEGMFLVGDAAGLIDPLTGNGMAMAIQSAALCAALLPEFLGPQGPGALARYATLHRDLFEGRLRASRMLASLMRNPLPLAAAIRSGLAGMLGGTAFRATRASDRECATILRLLGGH
ncbi:MAG TPA: NAD(P)/FAD-dependent oxidoreductase [Thermoanaerobaculia bacterium]|nr:NAD(P)/FAD-dependent oxidoreductase [Thermoanaerobaculia bacterium]